jgi:hypothetical protein
MRKNLNRKAAKVAKETQSRIGWNRNAEPPSPRSLPQSIVKEPPPCGSNWKTR